VAVIVTDEPNDAANGVLIGLKVGNNELLESDDVVRERNKTASPANIRSGGWFGKGRVRRMAVDENGHRCGDTVSAAFFGDRRTSGVARFASERAPTRKDELAQEHDVVSRERAVSLRCEKTSAGRRQFTPRLDFSQRVYGLSHNI
jgi:hypothetical protein